MEAVSPLVVARNLPQKTKKRFHNKILNWFIQNSRQFPWRKTYNPYNILIAELLLQKTNSRAVGEIYEEFIAKYSSPDEVAKAKLSDISKVVSPLGLFYRSERIKLICEKIVNVHSGEVPNNIKDLMSLKGVGRYVATAVLLFGFGEQVAVIDQNVIRILARIFEIRSYKSRPHTDRDLWAAARVLIPPNKAREYNLALLDLSALICKSRPLCDTCPVNNICLFYSRIQTQNAVLGAYKSSY